jgi:hypothetical protein
MDFDKIDRELTGEKLTNNPETYGFYSRLKNRRFRIFNRYELDTVLKPEHYRW